MRFLLDHDATRGLGVESTIVPALHRDTLLVSVNIIIRYSYNVADLNLLQKDSVMRSA
jgi:hypothetical protein